MVQFLSHVYLMIWARKVCSNLHMPYFEINNVSESLFTESSLISNRNISNYSRPTLEQESKRDLSKQFPRSMSKLLMPVKIAIENKIEDEIAALN